MFVLVAAVILAGQGSTADWTPVEALGNAFFFLGGGVTLREGEGVIFHFPRVIFHFPQNTTNEEDFEEDRLPSPPKLTRTKGCLSPETRQGEWWRRRTLGAT